MLSEVDGLWIWALALAAVLTVAVTTLVPTEEAAPAQMTCQDSYIESDVFLAHTDRGHAPGYELSLPGLGAEARQTIACSDFAQGSVWACIPEAASQASGLQLLALPCPQVWFDRSWYLPGDTASLTVTDPRYTGQPQISGTGALVLKYNGVVVASWDTIPAVAGTMDQFRVVFTIPEVMGMTTVLYTDPADPERTAQATAQVPPCCPFRPPELSFNPHVLVTETTISIVTVPEGAVANRLTFVIYAPRGITAVKVAELTATNTASITWDGGNLGDGPYLVVAIVEGPGGHIWTLREWMYIRR